MAVFDLFSKRTTPLPEVFQYDTLPQKLRNQIIWIWKRTILEHFSDYDGRVATNKVLRDVREVVCAEHGIHALSGNHNEIDDTLQFLQTSKDVPVLLDVIETSFSCLAFYAKQRYEYHNGRLLHDAIDTLNHRFRENGVGYEFSATAQKLLRVDNQLLHRDAVLPALSLLSGKGFKTANTEFLEAFDDYKKGDYGDCLTKCCSAFESTMKIICKTNGWQYNQCDTARPLLDVVFKNTDLPGFLQQPLITIATLRNKLSKSHGAGTSSRAVSDHLARYALHLTASSIVLLCDATQ